VRANLAIDPVLADASISVTGSAPTVPWGEPVWVEADVGVPAVFPLSLLHPSPLVLSARLYGTSNVPPP
jgi:hypothetical protein